MIAQLIISGIAVGSIYALLGLALVLIHKATDVVNFAQGEMSMFSAFIALVLLERAGLPLWLVFGLALPIGGLFGATVERLFIRPMAGAPPVNLLIV
ncbi:MAG TPA: branched-chain amino acid ABC transporter permease, partial [Burkholderiaceae bacterium]|nr:branched-chain amino acid ABC transporter permease [Burkholderiaceae bacterium]